MNAKNFCVVIPVFNEEVGIRSFVQKLYNFLSSEFPYTSKIIIINDNSTDRTLSELDDLKNSLKPLGSSDVCEIVVQTSNESRGYGNAVKEAFKLNFKKEPDFYIIMDSLLLLYLGKEGFELVSFYLYDRINPDGTINYLMDQDNNEVVLETSEDLFNLLCKVNPTLFD